MRRLRILIITQELDPDHPVLGFFYKWVSEMSKHLELLHIILYHNPRSKLPFSNIRLYTTSRKRNEKLTSTRSNLKRHSSLLGFLAILIKINLFVIKTLRNGGFDVIFCHMNPEFVLSVFFISKILRKPIVFWYLN